MDVFSVVIIVIMILLTLAWILRPLLTNPKFDAQSDISQQLALAELEQQRNAVYKNINDLELDFASAKVSAEDYEQVRAKYIHQAAVILKEIDQVSQTDSAQLDAEIDTLVKAFPSNGTPKSAKQSALLDLVRAEIKREATALQNGSTCPKCAHLILPDDVFCSECGTSLNALCPSCQSPFNPNDRFCRQCGTPLKTEVAQ